MNAGRNEQDCGKAQRPARQMAVAALLLGAAALAGTGAVLRSKSVAAQSAAPSSASLAMYTTKVQPIFRDNCYRCHGGMNHRGGLQMDTQSGLMRGGKDGAVIVPWHPEQSLLIKLIRHEGPPDDPMPMPPKSKLSDDDIAAVTAWIQAGAAMPADAPQ